MYIEQKVLVKSEQNILPNSEALLHLINPMRYYYPYFTNKTKSESSFDPPTRRGTARIQLNSF